MPAFFLHSEFQFDFPALTEPKWAFQVDRWYQLDSGAYGICHASNIIQENVHEPPACLLLASSGGSNDTDYSFAMTGALSPAKFIHTLPSVRASLFCQIMNWSGPMLCIQNDPMTLVTALTEAVDLQKIEWPTIWVVSVTKLNQLKGEQLPKGDKSNERQSTYQADVFVVSNLPSKVTGRPSFEISKTGSLINVVNKDSDFLTWLSNKNSEALNLPNQYQIQRAIV